MKTGSVIPPYMSQHGVQRNSTRMIIAVNLPASGISCVVSHVTEQKPLYRTIILPLTFTCPFQVNLCSTHAKQRSTFRSLVLISMCGPHTVSQLSLNQLRNVSQLSLPMNQFGFWHLDNWNKEILHYCVIYIYIFFIGPNIYIFVCIQGDNLSKMSWIYVTYASVYRKQKRQKKAFFSK